MKSIKQRITDEEIDFEDACTDYYNDLTQEDVDYIVKTTPWEATKHLNQHSFLTQEHVDFLVEKQPYFAAIYLYESPFFNQNHITYITTKEPAIAVIFLSHRLSEENLSYIAQNCPENYLKVATKRCFK